MPGKSCGGYVTCGLRLAPSSSGSGRGSVVNWRRGSPSLPLALSPSVPSSSCGAGNWSGEQAMPASGRGEWMRPAPLLPPHRLLRRLLLAGLALRTAHHRFTPMTTAMSHVTFPVSFSESVPRRSGSSCCVRGCRAVLAPAAAARRHVTRGSWAGRWGSECTHTLYKKAHRQIIPMILRYWAVNIQNKIGKVLQIVLY